MLCLLLSFVVVGVYLTNIAELMDQYQYSTHTLIIQGRNYGNKTKQDRKSPAITFKP